MKIKMLTDAVEQTTNLLGTQVRGGAATPMQLRDLTATFDFRANKLNFFKQIINVFIDALAVVSNDHGAATKIAQGVAKRQVEVQGEIDWIVVLIGATDFFLKFLLTKFSSKLWRRRIAGITRTRPVVPAQHLNIDNHWFRFIFAHETSDSLLSQTAP